MISTRKRIVLARRFRLMIRFTTTRLVCTTEGVLMRNLGMLVAPAGRLERAMTLVVAGHLLRVLVTFTWKLGQTVEIVLAGSELLVTFTGGCVLARVTSVLDLLMGLLMEVRSFSLADVLAWARSNAMIEVVRMATGFNPRIARDRGTGETEAI